MNKRQRQCLKARDIRSRDIVGRATRRERVFLMGLQDAICKESGFDTVGYHCALGHYWKDLAYFLRDRD
jgi:hypothetical protein